MKLFLEFKTIYGKFRKKFFILQIPERPADDTDRQAWIEWVAKLLPVSYAGVKSKPFYGLAFLVDGELFEHFLTEIAFLSIIL